MKFIDNISLTLQSGKGGPGCMSFYRETFRPRGGPDGGDGGRGGDVILRVNHHLNSLYHLRGRRKMAAKNGSPGMGQDKSGTQGEDLIIDVPPGTVVKNTDGEILQDLKEGEVVFLEGGRGGRGNAFFKTSVNQAPTHAQPGEEGKSMDVHLELRLIADVGVIGFPNAGKSTLVSVMTAAKPKIADYPFTTLNPQLGVVKVDATTTFTLADIPGLIEGAHEGVGLGDKFLQHIKRTKLFVHLLDVSDFSERDVWDDYEKINHELKMYDGKHKSDEGFEPLSTRSQIVVLNKMDSATPDRLEEIKSLFASKGIETISISAVSRKNLESLKEKLCDVIFGSVENG